MFIRPQWMSSVNNSYFWLNCPFKRYCSGMGRGCCTLQKLRWTGSRNLFTMWSWNTWFHAYQSVHTNLLQINVFTQKLLLIIFTNSFPLKANNIETLGSALELFGKVQWHHFLFLTCDFAHSQIRLNWATAIVNVSKSLLLSPQQEISQEFGNN